MLFKFSFSVPFKEKVKIYNLIVRSNFCPKKDEIVDLLLDKITEANKTKNYENADNYKECLKALSSIDNIPDIVSLNVDSLPIACKNSLGNSLIKVSKLKEHVLESPV